MIMRKLAFILAGMLFSASLLSAQELNSSYFLSDRYLYGYRINPAYSPNDGTFTYAGFLIGDMSFSTRSNVGASHFFFPDGDRLLTAFHPDVDADRFLSALPETSKIDLDYSSRIVSLGSCTNIGFLTFDVGITAGIGGLIHKAAFEKMKLGTQAGDVKVDDLSLNANSYLDISANQSIVINDDLSIGVGLSALLGLANGRIGMEQLLDDNLKIDPLKIASVLGNSFAFKFGGAGAAIDLGFKWKTPVPGLSIDGAVLDLGGLFRREQKPKDGAETAKRKLSFDMIPWTVNLGTKYNIPSYDRFTVGLLGTMQFGDMFYYNIAAGLGIVPVNFLDLALSAGYNSYGPNCGAMINLRIPALAIFAGVDTAFNKYTPQYIPVNRINVSVKAGLTFVIGNARDKTQKHNE